MGEREGVRWEGEVGGSKERDRGREERRGKVKKAREVQSHP